MLRAPARVGPPQGARMDIGRVAPGFGWFGLGALAAGATAWAIFSRTGRAPSDGHGEPDGHGQDGQQHPDVVLDVPELEVDKITLEVRHLRAHVSILAELANLVNISVGVDARLEEVKLEIDGVEAEARQAEKERDRQRLQDEGPLGGVADATDQLGGITDKLTGR